MEVNLNITKFEDWVSPTVDNVLISGPCSAESEEQMLATAKEIVKAFPNNIFRAGIWKPRTRPNAFEGVGSVGLEWMQTVKQETGMRTATEVANAKHVEECLKAGIDLLWVGARTTVNPFSVQEIADALKGVDIPVLVKNPVNPDLQLWVGALERLNQAGITKIGAIHRGFSSTVKSKYRNSPNWTMAIDLKRLLPELPVICDPSHIGGKRDLIEPLSQKAMDLEMRGLMVETHINPSVALSDAAQQLTPAALIAMIQRLELRSLHAKAAPTDKKLSELRKKIDKTDEKLLKLLSERKNIIEKIGELKRDNGLTVLQLNRWDEVLKNRLKLAEELNLNPIFIEKFLVAMHEESIAVQVSILNAVAGNS